MAQQLIGPFLVGAVIAAAVLVAQAFANRTAHLKLGLFRPWRGDPWPIGVQEDDDFRFAWTTAAALDPTADAARATSLPAGLPGIGEPDLSVTVDDLPSGLAVAPVSRVHLRPAEDRRRPPA